MNVARSMDGEVFKYHLDRCIASGLWVPNANGGEDEEEEPTASGAGKEPSAPQKTQTR